MFLVDFASLIESKDHLDFNLYFLAKDDFIKLKKNRLSFFIPLSTAFSFLAYIKKQLSLGPCKILPQKIGPALQCSS